MTQLVLSYVKMCMLKIIILLSPCSCVHYKNPTVSTGTYIIAASDGPVVDTLSNVLQLNMANTVKLCKGNNSLFPGVLSSTTCLNLMYHLLVLSSCEIFCSSSLLPSHLVGTHPHVRPVCCETHSIDLLPTIHVFGPVSNLCIPISPMPYWVPLVLVCQYHIRGWMYVSSPIWCLPLCYLGCHQCFVGLSISYPVVFPIWCPHLSSCDLWLSSCSSEPERGLVGGSLWHWALCWAWMNLACCRLCFIIMVHCQGFLRGCWQLYVLMVRVSCLWQTVP